MTTDWMDEDICSNCDTISRENTQMDADRRKADELLLEIQADIEQIRRVAASLQGAYMAGVQPHEAALVIRRLCDAATEKIERALT